MHAELTEPMRVRRSAERGVRPALVSAAIAAVLVVGVALHVRGMNGPWYWWWDWWVMPARRWYPWMIVAALPVMLAGCIEIRCGGIRSARVRRLSHVAAIFLLAGGVVAMKIIALACFYPTFSPIRIGAIVFDSETTTYYTDAGAISSVYHDWSWLATYPDWLSQMNMHTVSKPPGPLAYHMLFIRAQGYGLINAETDGIVLAILAALSIPATYWLLRVLTRDRSASLIGTVMLALCPGFVLIYPSFDAAYVALAAAVLACWHLALWRKGAGAIAWAAAAGVMIAVTAFMTYTLLVLGIFMVGDAVLCWHLRPGSRAPTARVAGRGAVAIGAIVAVYVALFWVTGFNPVLTFVAAWRNQHLVLSLIPRPYPWTILFDLTDFVFSAAWIVVVPVVLAVRRYWLDVRRPLTAAEQLPLGWLVVLALAQPLVVAITGLVQTETARVWNFMLPLLLLPAAIEMARWRPWARGLFYGCMLVLMLVIGQNMQFLSPLPALR